LRPGGFTVRRLPTVVQSTSDNKIAIRDADALRGRPTFRTCDLEHARQYIARGVLVEHKLAYLPRERSLDFSHRQAKLGHVAINSMAYGAGVMVTAPALGFYLLQFTLSGVCEIWQDRAHTVLPTGSVAIVNPFRPYRKAWHAGTRQLFLRIDQRLIEQEFRLWTGVDKSGRIEFELSPICDMTMISPLTRYVRLLCDDLNDETSGLSHPHICDRMASGLASILLASMPHNRRLALEPAASGAAPFYVRRVERFIEQHARDPIALEDLTSIAGVSTRALQTGFRRFRNTTPMGYLRAIRLELARTELARGGPRRSVAAIASALELGHLGRFARDYRFRFGEPPSQTLRRGDVGG
jgi:AraC-like DNA-binding protein